MFFANDNRDKVREDNPGISFGTFLEFPLAKYMYLTKPTGEVGKNLGAKWRGLDDDSDEKKLYNKKAADDKKRYEEEMAAYRKKLEEAEGDSDKESGSDQE